MEFYDCMTHVSIPRARPDDVPLFVGPVCMVPEGQEHPKWTR